MDPGARRRVRRCQCVLPDGDDVGVHRPQLLLEGGEVRAHELVLLVQRPRPGRGRRTRGVERPHGQHEAREVVGQALGLLHRAGDGVHAVDPAAHRPRPREAVARRSEPRRHGRRERQRGSDAREPLELAHERVDRPVDARHPYRQVLAQAVHGVVGAVRGDGLDGQRRPLGELRGDEAGDERGIRVHLVVVHARHRTTLTPAVVTARASPRVRALLRQKCRKSRRTCRR